MVKSRIFDNTQLLKEHPELPHYKEEVVCFRSEYKDRSYPANECYFTVDFRQHSNLYLRNIYPVWKN